MTLEHPTLLVVALAAAAAVAMFGLILGRIDPRKIAAGPKSTDPREVAEYWERFEHTRRSIRRMYCFQLPAAVVFLGLALQLV